ncbi:secreted protein, partial [Candidatus Thiomargarita nelsonii]
MQKKLILIIIGMILIPPAFGVQDEYTQFECEATPEVCLSRVIAKLQDQISALEKATQAQQDKLQNKISALETQIQALKKENAALASQLENSLRTSKEKIKKLKSGAFQDRLKNGG